MMRGTVVAACAGMIAALVLACSDDDSTSDSGTADAAGTDASTPPLADSGAETAADDAPAGDVADTGAQTPEAGHDAGAHEDAGHDAGGDATMGADASDGATALAPLNLCPTLDVDWALNGSPCANAGGLCLDGVPSDDYAARSGSWGNDITAPGPNSFSALLGADCNLGNIQQFLSPTAGSSATSNYLDQVIAFNVQFMGCAYPDAGAAAFSGLIPAAGQTHTFTMADLNEIANLYVNAVIAEASLNWATYYPTNNPEPLTGAQVEQIQAQLAAMAAAMPGVNPSTTRFTLSTCGDDAGADAGAGDSGETDSGGADGGGVAEGGADAGGG